MAWVVKEKDLELMHFGTPRHSGRYPWGSGDDPHQGAKTFLDEIKGLEKQGMTKAQIAKAFGVSTKELNENRSNASAAYKADLRNRIQTRLDSGMSRSAVGRELGINESTIRSMMNETRVSRAKITDSTVDALKAQVAEKTFLDIGAGTERYLGISSERLNNAVRRMQDEGYTVGYPKQEQMGTGKFTVRKVLMAPETPTKDVYSNLDKIQIVATFTEDGGNSWLTIKPPKMLDSSRVAVKYVEDGGGDMDGMMLVRRGVQDLSLGKSRYAQVRIGVDGTHYLKGMAMYSDDLPKGVDVMFNTNKHKPTDGTDPQSTANKLNTMKEMKKDAVNPFGATYRQLLGADGQPYSVMNLVNEEGSWEKWGKTISSQFLSKQSVELATQQLGLAQKRSQEDFDSIMTITEPTVRKLLLEKFADGADSDAVHLKGAALPKQGTKVLIPIPTLSDNEVVCPTYPNGTRLALIRYPHAGAFEIADVRVNNKGRNGQIIPKDSIDAIGVSKAVADKLSGADFDGDSVVTIPNTRTGPYAIKTMETLPGLKNFDTKEAYGPYEGLKTIDGGIMVKNPTTGKLEIQVQKGKTRLSGQQKQVQMGSVSNLITDMQIQGADINDIERAVKHSMVVIDSEKHHLDFRQSAIDNGIKELKKKYQPGGGAGTLVSRASGDMWVDDRKTISNDPATGQKRYIVKDGKTYVNAAGDTVTIKPRRIKSTQMYETNDAFTLSSGTPMETVYAEYANTMKAMGNQARLEAGRIKAPKKDPAAAKVYANEVASLQASLDTSKKNAPLERQAQGIAGLIVAQKEEANGAPLTGDALKKARNQALAEGRARTGAGRERNITVTQQEWMAIENGAISPTTLKDILNNTDMGTIRRYAQPKSDAAGLTTAQQSRIRTMTKNGYTSAEIAENMGISPQEVSYALAEERGGE